MRLRTLELLAKSAGEFYSASKEPLYEELARIVFDLTKIYEADLDDWQFVYSARPNSGVG